MYFLISDILARHVLEKETYSVLARYSPLFVSKPVSVVSTFTMLIRLLPIAVLCVHVVLAQASTPSLGADGFIRFGCSQLVVERTDPLVTPGTNPSPHMQYVVHPEIHDQQTHRRCIVALPPTLHLRFGSLDARRLRTMLILPSTQSDRRRKLLQRDSTSSCKAIVASEI
jgi:hypothetical protein